jgi:hypothetical protein
LVLLTLLVFAGGGASHRATIKIRAEVVEPANGNVEICRFLRIPTTTPFVMGSGSS